MKAHPTGRQQGFALLLVASLILVIAAGAVGTYALMNARDKNKTAQSQTETTGEESAQDEKDDTQSGLGLAANQRNTARRADANNVLAAVAEFVSNNTGNYPTKFESGELRGGEDSTPAAVKLEWYRTVGFASGAQQPLLTDTIRIVPGATCKDGGGTVVGVARSLAVQYSLEDRGDARTPKCNVL